MSAAQPTINSSTPVTAPPPLSHGFMSFMRDLCAGTLSGIAGKLIEYPCVNPPLLCLGRYVAKSPSHGGTNQTVYQLLLCILTHPPLPMAPSPLQV